jgi:hypothetical protein
VVSLEGKPVMTRITDEEVARVAKAMSKIPAMTDDDMTELALAAGVVETAVADAIMRFPNDGSESFSAFLERVKPQVPHWYPPVEPGDDLDAALIEAACGAKPTLSARAALLKAAGPETYGKILRAWGCSERTLAPGVNPKAEAKSASDNDARDKRRKDHSGNPFHKSQWNISKQGALIKSLGLDKANAIAKSVGSHVGATRPNPDF